MAKDWLDTWQSASPDTKRRWLGEIEKRHGHAEEKSGRVVTDTLLRSFRRMSVNRKLIWLEEANRFIARVASRRTKRLHRLFREGKI